MKELILAAVAVATITASTVNAQTKPDSQSPWEYSESIDPVWDQNTSSLYLESDLTSRTGDDAPRWLSVICDGNGGYNVYMWFDDSMGVKSDTIPVRYRFDGSASVSERWESLVGIAAILRKGYKKDFMTGVRSGKNFIFEVTDDEGNTSHARFKNGDHEKLEFVISGCKPDSQSPWEYSERIDPFSDKNTSSLSLDSDLASRTGDDAPKWLFVKCDGNGGYIVFMFFDGDIGGTSGTIPVRYRFDGSASVSERWESLGVDEAILPNGYKKDFMTGVRSGKNFLFEATDDEGNTSHTRFKNGDHEKFEFVIGGCQG